MNAPAAVAAPAGEATGPTLGAASNFGQHWQPGMFAAARRLGVRNFRDAVYWSEVERDHRYVFDTPDTTWPDHLAADQTTSLTVNNGHKGYDGGDTPYTPDAIRAFAADAAATVQHFPRADAVEVGNEMNAQNFVSGPVRAEGLAQRPARYLAILKATYAAVKSARPDLRVLGGALHSIPVGYVRRLFALGAARYMDALAFHPYTTPPEQLDRQIAVLRQVPGLAHMPLEATEFGDPDPATAPGTLLRYYCQLALAGVTRAVWYPLNPRGDGLTPLIGADLRPTPTGRAFATAQRLMEHRAVTDAAPDPFTYACRFAPDTLVIWGAPRRITPAPGQHAFSPEGRPMQGPLTLSESDPLILTGPGKPGLGRQRVLADSYDQFAYPGGAVRDGFERYAMDGAARVPLILMPGQEAGGRPWTPYLAARGNPDVRLQADTLLPGGGGTHVWRIVQDWHAPDAQRIRAEVQLAPAKRSGDGVRLRISLGGRLLEDRVVTSALDWKSPPLSVTKGEVLSVSVGPNGNARGDVTTYRITIRRDG
ncbi:hypothetical protein U879_16895 [Defluviimonas sp. 20V17]|uniref:Asl1-like glycosyl hydrolase catalytic domain-containing protein n=1 Tax=Allgaiera indica TaxID=765699 RepID=A0AAN4US74_9RHOB|nr:hypothetical protein [Allgaiera indica]KDB02508.1 hypothetical protein U879_16895 [Defluviimonas sp. 20V17]GHE01973.1 hypothetical protein GCM10008024_19720 [Allgaiera indica]